MLKKLLETVTKNFTQWKILCTLKINVFEIPIRKVLENCLQNMNCFSWIRLIPFLIHLKYGYYNSPYLELFCLPHHFCIILPEPTETPLQNNSHQVLHRFPHFFLVLFVVSLMSKANKVNAIDNELLLTLSFFYLLYFESEFVPYCS